MSKENKSNKKKTGPFKRLILYMKPWWGILFFIVILSFAGAILSVLVPGFIKNITNEIEHGISHKLNNDVIVNNSYSIFIVLGASFLCNFIQALLTPIISQRTGEKMRYEINEKSNRIPLNYFDTNNEGETLSTMTNDIDQISTSFGNTLPSMITSVCTIVGCLVLMFFTNTILAIATIVASLIGVFITMGILAKSAPYFKMNQDKLGQINSIINEDIKGHLVIKSFGAEKEVTKGFKKLNEQLYESTWKSQFVSAVLMPISLFSSNLGYIIICIVGAFLVIGGKTTIGTIIAFISYVKLFSDQISTLTQSVGTIQPALASSERVFNLLDYDEMKDEGKEELSPNDIKGIVDFEHIKFGYVEDNIIIHDFSCNVKQGQKIAIVGPTGAGKSTLINLLTRFYEVNDGDIKIDGTSIYDLKRESLHNLISMVLQDTWTFEGSIRDNIVYSKEDVDSKQLDTVIENCGLTDFMKGLPDGMDTILGEESEISAGQKQLLTIARAMIKNAPILILDEATSSVDTRTEKIISTALDKLMEGRTSFVIAHRLSTIKNADLILVLKDGDIIETGNHDKLMKQGGFYADLYMSQFDTSTSM